MASSSQLLPVILQSFPACNDCVSWSQDNIAVAGGEIVYILTPRDVSSQSDTAGHPQWQILSFRANLFRREEWPEQTLAPVTELSIGEEQSNSLVVALSWSSAGLGRHRRSVLAVLTSNLVLSMWETDGSSGNYHRTSVVNYVSALQPHGQRNNPSRQTQRIRSFTWLPTLQTSSMSRWGQHYLAVANDSGMILILSVSRRSENSVGQETWKYDFGLELNSNDLVPVDSNPTVDLDTMSPLQQRIYQQAPVTKLHVEPWSQMKPAKEGKRGANPEKRIDSDVFNTKVVITKGSRTFAATVCASISHDSRQISLYHDENASLDNSAGKQSKILKKPKHVACKDNEPGFTSPIVLDEGYFKEVIQPLRNEYDSNYQLFGNVKTKFWGLHLSPDDTRAVACITLHPSDMVEYYIPSSERCHLVFKNTGLTRRTPDANLSSDTSAYEQILQYARDALSQNPAIDSLFDRKLCRAYINLAEVKLDSASALTSSLKALSPDLGGWSVNGSKGHATSTGEKEIVHSATGIEECEICGSPLPFTTDTSRAYCASGHQFTRCQLSFLAIQEPGISKYCSRCGKQFLDLPKLGSIQGPSFARLVFDEFDICPYCQAKYRG